MILTAVSCAEPRLRSGPSAQADDPSMSGGRSDTSEGRERPSIAEGQASARACPRLVPSSARLLLSALDSRFTGNQTERPDGRA